MAQQVQLDLNIDYLKRAIEMAIASLKRSHTKTGINPAMRQLIDQDIAEYQKALASIKPAK